MVEPFLKGLGENGCYQVTFSFCCINVFGFNVFKLWFGGVVFACLGFLLLSLQKILLDLVQR